MDCCNVRMGGKVFISCSYQLIFCTPFGEESNAILSLGYRILPGPERVQRYFVRNEWDYETKLSEFIDGGLEDSTFIDSVSRILSRGCHAPGCSELEVRRLDKRKSNFFMIVNDVFDIPAILATSTPTQQPTTMQPTDGPIPSTKHPSSSFVGLPVSSSDDSPNRPVFTMPPVSNPNPSLTDKNDSPNLQMYDDALNDDELIRLDGNGTCQKQSILSYLAPLFATFCLMIWQ